MNFCLFQTPISLRCSALISAVLVAGLYVLTNILMLSTEDIKIAQDKTESELASRNYEQYATRLFAKQNLQRESRITAVVSPDISVITYYVAIQVYKGKQVSQTNLRMYFPSQTMLTVVPDDISIERTVEGSGWQKAIIRSTRPADETGKQSINFIINSPLPAVWSAENAQRPQIEWCNFHVSPIQPFDYSRAQPL